VMYLGLTTGDERVRGYLELLPNIGGTWRHKSQLLQEPHTIVGNKFAAPMTSPDGKEVPSSLCFPDIALERIIPRYFIVPVREVFLMFDFKTNDFESLPRGVDFAHFGDTIAYFDAVCDFFVQGNRGVPRIGHDPLVDTELDAKMRGTRMKGKGMNIPLLQA